MCGPKYCPMHNFRDIDWERVQAAVTEHRQRRAALTR
jgi:phosphomethylpyrimidine synthase